MSTPGYISFAFFESPYYLIENLHVRKEVEVVKKRGFTLIELLIVVAIIAILAAIAVPNFLEAQVRSKVSRVKSDMRTLATGIEAYYVDYNHAPIDHTENAN